MALSISSSLLESASREGDNLRTGFCGVTIPFNTLFPTSGDAIAAWLSVCEKPDTEEVALTKRSDRVIG